jgi:hypothetical protein
VVQEDEDKDKGFLALKEFKSKLRLYLLLINHCNYI